MFILIATLGIITIICLYYLDNASVIEQDTTSYKLANIWVYTGVGLLTIIALYSIPYRTSNDDSFAEENARLSEITIQRDSLATKELSYRKILRDYQTELIDNLCNHTTLTPEDLDLLNEVNTFEQKVDSIEYIKANL